jgi:hypothetical protein
MKINKLTYDGDGVVDVAVGKEVGAQALLLDLTGQHLAHAVRIVEQVPHLAYTQNQCCGSGIR